MNLDLLINNFATRSFRDTGDGDYIAARLAYRAQLIPQFLWSSLQAIEKYLKCVLVLNRIRAPRSHNLADILQVFEANKKFDLKLTEETRQFLVYLDTYGRHRYYETPYYTRGHELMSLDCAVWEVRRYARVMDYSIKNLKGKSIERLSHELAVNESAENRPPHRFTIIGGRLESIIAKRDHPSREPLLWQNAFFGLKPRKTITLPGRSEGGNSPLSLHPEILDEVLKYVHLPKDVVQAYRDANWLHSDGDLITKN
jgi:HEPN domain-containing protein